MATRTEDILKISVKGVPYTVTLIDYPTIDDVVGTEAKLCAMEFANSTTNDGHRVDLAIRDILIRLGVER
jgi:hypothetical protein